MKSKPMTTRSVKVMKEKADHSQSEAWVLMWMAALGGLRSKAWLPIAATLRVGWLGSSGGCVRRGADSEESL